MDCVSVIVRPIAFTFVLSPNAYGNSVSSAWPYHVTRIMNTFNVAIQKRMHTVIKRCLTCNERKQITFMMDTLCNYGILLQTCNVYSPSKAVSSNTLFPTVQVCVNCTSMAFCLLLNHHEIRFLSSFLQLSCLQRLNHIYTNHHVTLILGNKILTYWLTDCICLHVVV